MTIPLPTLISPSPGPTPPSSRPTSQQRPPPRSLQQLLDEQESAPRALKVCTYNIQDGRNSRLEKVIRNLDIQHIDIAILTEMRIPASAPIHTRNSQGYSVYATYTSRTNQGGVGLVFRQPCSQSSWCIESIQRHGPNVLSCHVMIGNKRQPLIVAPYTV